MPELSAATSLTLRWFYEESCTFFFTARFGHGDEGTQECCYTLNLSTYEIIKVLPNGSSDESWEDMYGYEFNREKFLASLLEERDGGTISIYGGNVKCPSAPDPSADLYEL
ncbi:unnamed protein product [Urochloa humidicola]